MSLRFSVLSTVLAALAALVTIVLMLEHPVVEQREFDRTRHQLAQAIEHVQPLLADPSLFVEAARHTQSQVARIAGETATRILVTCGKKVLADSAQIHPVGVRAPWKPTDFEIASATPSDFSEAFRIDTDFDQATQFVARQFRVSPEVLCHVRASRPTALLDASHRSTRDLLFVGFLIAIVTALLLSVVLARTVVQPIENLTAIADDFSKGDLAKRTGMDRPDEIGTLARSLDRMADQIQRQLSQVRDEGNRLSAVLNSMVEGVFVTDTSGRIVLANQALTRMADGPLLEEKPWQALGSEDIKTLMQKASEGPAHEQEMELQFAGTKHHLAVQVAPLPEGGCVGVLHDISALKRTDDIRRDFVANASHELRTPLTAIRGFAETLRDSEVDPDTATRFLGSILRHTKRLQGLVDDLLDLSRLESRHGTLDLAPVDLCQVVQDVTMGLEGKAKEKSITLTTLGTESPTVAQTNAWAMDHILVNLVDNALKYTPEGGQVRVILEQKQHHVVVQVADTGPGIQEQEQQRIFERFYRVDEGRTRDQGGTGLGLAIVKHLAQRIGAELLVESDGKRGTTFQVNVPV